jgi:FG-GAP-like repeat
LAWYEKSGKIHPLNAIPGALQTFVRDLNGDKLPDIIALMAQGNEGVFSFINQGKGEFLEKQVLQFPSIYGSSSIDLIDFDGDGDEDILYVNGDNGDYSRITKPYHGIRIFLNNGKNEFQEKYFFQMNGATKAIAKDFDNDGDLDIAAIAFFADFSQKPQNSFVVLENKGKLNFIPKSSDLTAQGRWLTMEATDFDKDGDQDILLGSCVDVPLKAPQEIKTEWKKANSKLLFLENTIK